MWKFFLLILTFWDSAILIQSQNEPSCDELIYCQGKLLDTIQMARIFNDSKTFVDMKILDTVNNTLQKFEDFMNANNQNPSHDKIVQFVNENFETFNEFEDWVPPDYTKNPKFLQHISDDIIRQFARDLVGIWPQLARKIKQDIIANPEQYSLIPVDNGFIIPGGRFKEFYYWDSYWIVKGLLISEMTETVRGMLENFLSFVERFGFIPNGARVYYLNRSQPPLLTMMVDAYITATNDTEWLRANIDLIEDELVYWLEKKTVEVTKKGVTYTLAHYDSESGSPRPESYYEDVMNADHFNDENEKIQLYADLKSGAESGWDFSSRWIFDKNGGNIGNITFLKTRRAIPVDLNAFLCKDFQLLSQFYQILENENKSVYWQEKSAIWQKTIEQVLYDEDDGIWYDYDRELNKPRKYFHPSNFAPLWTESYNKSQAIDLGKKAAAYFIQEGIMDYYGGIPASTAQTGEQWDFPNAWAPLQSIVIFGLEQTGDSDALVIAKEFAKRWIQSNLIGFQQTGEMFEKYDAVNPGQYGGGGEYTVQSGFGWTNGAALEFINYYYAN